MKFSAILLTSLALGSSVEAVNRPQLTIQVHDGKFNSFHGLDPTLTWCGQTSQNDVQLTAGVAVSAVPSSDINSYLPRNIWGSAKRMLPGGWGVKATADMSDRDLTSAAVTLEVENVRNDLTVKASATAGSINSLQRLSLTKGFTIPGNARMTINPKYDVPSKTGDITVGYGNRLTAVEVNGSLVEQSIRLSQQLDARNRIAPSFAVQSRKLAIEWEKDLGNGNSLTTTLRPNESFDVQWKDGEWEANIEVPIEGKSVNGPNVSIKRDVIF